MPSKETKDQLNELQLKIRQGLPIDESHPGFEQNLTPLQQDAFKVLTSGDQHLTSEQDEKQLEGLKKQIVQGKPLDETHEGMENLTPRQQDAIRTKF